MLLNEFNDRSNPRDTATVDVPLLIRLLEYAREDAKDDMDLHDVTERIIALAAEGKTLSMDDYDAIVGEPMNEVSPELLDRAARKAELATNKSIKAANKALADKDMDSLRKINKRTGKKQDQSIKFANKAHDKRKQRGTPFVNEDNESNQVIARRKDMATNALLQFQREHGIHHKTGGRYAATSDNVNDYDVSNVSPEVAKKYREIHSQYLAAKKAHQEMLKNNPAPKRTSPQSARSKETDGRYVGGKNRYTGD